ncbi:hypothetical protein [Curtobacterium sp. B8]|uniref:hypothetical protein n=1 Tax=Curtobacterium sp. B8 TaxID=95611 RepID=UPI00034D024C|nr:hypothetical protein [Curtobacterium sp. B8]
MRNRIILVGLIILFGFWLGARANRPVVKGSKAETARRALADRRARKRRKALKRRFGLG